MYAAELELAPYAEVMRHMVIYVKAVRAENERRNRCPELKAHFDHVLRMQEVQLESRAEQGYSSQVGMPDDGDILSGLMSVPDGADLMPESYEPPAVVRDWFGARETLLFRYARPPGFWDSLDKFIGTAGTRFAQDAFEPPVFHVKGPVPVIGLPQDLPDGWERPVDFSGVWMLLRRPDLALVLRLEFESRQSLELLFRPQRHRALIARMLCDRRIGLAFASDQLMTLPLEFSDAPALEFLARSE